MFKHRHKIFSALTVASLCLVSPFFATRNSWAGEFSVPEATSLIKQLKSQSVEQAHERYPNANPKVVLSAMITALQDPDARVRKQIVSLFSHSE